MTRNLCWRDIWFDPIDHYVIDENGDVTTTSNALPSPDIYESTNGSVYVVLKSTELKNGEYVKKPYKIDMLVLWTFARESFSKSCVREDDSPNSALFIDIIHKDGNQLNNNISNLEAKRPEEIWQPLVFRDVEEGRYEISTFGRIRQKKKGEWVILKIHKNSDKDGYHVYSLKVTPFRPKRPCTNMKRHIIVASFFVYNPDPEMYTQVNHINGCKTDNSPSNLEWVSPHMNTNHAIMCKLSPNQRTLSTVEIDMIRDMLLDPKYNGSPLRVFDAIDTLIHPNITYNVVNAIKANSRVYIRTDSKYGTEEIEFPKCSGFGRVSHLTPNLAALLDRMCEDPKYRCSGGVNRGAIYEDFHKMPKTENISKRMVFDYLKNHTTRHRG